MLLQEFDTAYLLMIVVHAPDLIPSYVEGEESSSQPGSIWQESAEFWSDYEKVMDLYVKPYLEDGLISWELLAPAALSYEKCSLQCVDQLMKVVHESDAEVELGPGEHSEPLTVREVIRDYLGELYMPVSGRKKR